MKLTWQRCQCGSPICKREYPTNIGTFYQGSGFDPEEKELMDQAFALLEDDSPSDDGQPDEEQEWRDYDPDC